MEKVIQCYLAALEVFTSQAFPAQWATVQNNLGVAYLERLTGERAENLEAAIHYFSSALEVRTRQAFPYDWAITQNNLGITYRERLRGERIENLETAIHYFSSALEVRTRQAFPEKYAETKSNLGFAYQDTQQFQSAYIAFADAIDTIESLRSEMISGSGTEEDKQTLAQQWNNLYRRMVEVCLQLNKPTEAIEYAEHSKTRNLVEQIFTRDLKSIVTQEEDLNKLEQLRDAIASGQYDIQNAKAENATTLAQHLQQLREQRNELQDKYLPVGSGFQFEQFQSTLNDKIAIVYLYMTNTGLETFIITCDSLKHLNVSNVPEKPALVNWGNEYLETYNQNKTEWLNSLASSLSHLSEILNIDEIMKCEEIKKCSRLILIPHRFLHLFPLHALPLANGDFLCDRFPEGVGYAPSCQLLQLAKTRKRPDFTHLFAIQNPTKDRPYVDFGVEAIRPYFQPNDYVLPGDKAIKANLIQSEQLRSAHCFHFFGHAKFNFEKSALILADGHLTLGEIFALDLNQCRLVILSACETGMTDFNSISDEYIGLPSGFLFAGSPSVVSTLWEVDQLSAAFLMIEFYENLRKYKQLEEGDIAIALNLAQKRLRDLTVDEFKKRLIKYKALIDEILSKLPKVERRKAEASITYRLSQAYPFAHPSDWAAFTATGI